MFLTTLNFPVLPPFTVYTSFYFSFFYLSSTYLLILVAPGPRVSGFVSGVLCHALAMCYRERIITGMVCPPQLHDTGLGVVSITVYLPRQRVTRESPVLTSPLLLCLQVAGDVFLT